MEYNTNLDFIPVSGGEIQNTHHVEFVPLGSGVLPQGEELENLPSGSVYVRANNGQVPMVNYTGASGIHSMRRGDLVAIYNARFDANASGAQEQHIITFENTLLEPSDIIEKVKAPAGHDRITARVSGLYRVDYTARVEVTNATDNYIIFWGQLGQERRFADEIANDIRFMESRNHCPGNGGEASAKCQTVITLTSGDYMEFVIQRNETGSQVQFEGATLVVELIKPLAGSGIGGDTINFGN